MATARHGARSSGLKIELTGTLAAKGALKKRFNKAEDALGDEIMKAAINTANIARKSIQRGSKTGITYEKYNPRRTHQASAKGEAPATDTGRLVGSITQEKTGELEAIVGSTVEYSKFLEFGTTNMDERPFLRPALKQAGKEFEKEMLDRLGGKRSRLGDFMTTGVKRG